MSKESAAVKVTEAPPEPAGTVSLTKRLAGMGGVVCELIDMTKDDDGNDVQTVHELDVRRAVLLALKQGSSIAAQKNSLSDAEQTRCWILGNALANEDNTGYTFKPEDVVLIKKLAKLRFPGVEPYCPLIEVIDPTAFEEDKK